MRYPSPALVRKSVLALLFCGICLVGLQSSPTAAQETDLSAPLSRPLSVQAQIVGGANAQRGEFPWQVRVLPGGFQCGGSLIHQEWVLTAAHCLYDSDGSIFTAGQISAVLGEHSLDINEGSEQERQISSFIIHPSYNENSSDSDLALLRLSSPVAFNQFVQPISVINPTEGSLIAARQLGTIMGWGATSENGPTATILQKVSVPLVSLKTCRDAYSNDLVTNNMVCAGEKDKDSCQGDSGGPLVVQGPSGWRLAGVVSWGIGCARDEYFGVYTRLINYVDWINQEAQLVPTATPSPTNTPLPPTPTNTASPTSTAVPGTTPLPTATSMVNPTATPGVSDGNLLKNGDFELGGNGDWYESSSTFASSSSVLILELRQFQNSIDPHSGDYAVWLGGADLEKGNLIQSVSIPASFPVTLSYFYQIRAQDDCGGDSVTISVNNTIIENIELCRESQTSGWFQNTIDLSDYAGQFVTLGFNISTDDHSPIIGEAAAASNFFLDDVVITAGTGGLPTASPTAAPTATPSPTLAPTQLTPNTPVPTPTSTPVTAPNVIENSSFEETSSDAWQENSEIYGGKGSLITSVLDLPQGIAPNSGSYIAWLGGASNEKSQLAQQIVLPADAEGLNFYYEIRSADACGYDEATVMVNQDTLVAFKLCVTEQTDDWQLHTLDISQYAGQTVDLSFGLATDDLLVSNWFVDDIVVATSARPQIVANPAALTFTKANADDVASQSVAVSMSENTVWSIVAESDGWLKANVRGGNVGVGPGAIQVSVDSSNRNKGTYNGTISLRAGAALVTVPVTMEILVDTVGDASPDVVPLDANPGLSNIALAWGIPRSNKVNMYQIYRRNGQSFELIDSTEEPRVRDDSTSLVAGERYCYQVSGVNAPARGTAVGPALATSEVACATFGQLPLWLPTFVGKPGDKLAVPVNVSNAEGLSLLESDLWIDFDTSVISVTGVSQSAHAVTADWRVDVSEITNVKSRAKVSMSTGSTVPGARVGLPAIYGNGPLFYLDVEVVGSASARAALEFRNNITGIGGSSITIADGSAEGQTIPLDLTDGLLTIEEFGAYRWGDTDSNGQVEDSDVVALLDFATRRTTPTNRQFNAAEVNGTGAIEAADVTRIFYHAATGNWPPLPPARRDSGGTEDGSTPALQEITLSVTNVESAGGELVNILVESSGLNNFAGGDLILIYDPAVIASIRSVSLGNQLDGFRHAYNDTIPGRLAISIAGINEVDDVTQLALIEVEMARVLSTKISPLRLADATLNDLNGRDLIHSFADKTITLENATVTLQPGTMEMFLPFTVQ